MSQIYTVVLLLLQFVLIHETFSYHRTLGANEIGPVWQTPNGYVIAEVVPVPQDTLRRPQDDRCRDYEQWIEHSICESFCNENDNDRSRPCQHRISPYGFCRCKRPFVRLTDPRINPDDRCVPISECPPLHEKMANKNANRAITKKNISIDIHYNEVTDVDKPQPMQKTPEVEHNLFLTPDNHKLDTRTLLGEKNAEQDPNNHAYLLTSSVLIIPMNQVNIKDLEKKLEEHEVPYNISILETQNDTSELTTSPTFNTTTITAPLPTEDSVGAKKKNKEVKYEIGTDRDENANKIKKSGKKRRKKVKSDIVNFRKGIEQTVTTTGINKDEVLTKRTSLTEKKDNNTTLITPENRKMEKEENEKVNGIQTTKKSSESGKAMSDIVEYKTGLAETVTPTEIIKEKVPLERAILIEKEDNNTTLVTPENRKLEENEKVSEPHNDKNATTKKANYEEVIENTMPHNNKNATTKRANYEEVIENTMP